MVSGPAARLASVRELPELRSQILDSALHRLQDRVFPLRPAQSSDGGSKLFRDFCREEFN
jgi:hypothetical protein